MVSTQDFESCDPSSNLGGTYKSKFKFWIIYSSIEIYCIQWQYYWIIKASLFIRLCGAMVARLTPDQKVACSNHVRVKKIILYSQSKYFYNLFFIWKMRLIGFPPCRGIEPRPRRWERRILTTRPTGMWFSSCLSGMLVLLLHLWKLVSRDFISGSDTILNRTAFRSISIFITCQMMKFIISLLFCLIFIVH